MDQDDADETLMLRYRDGDVQAFERLYTRHKAPLYRYLLRQCASAAIAEELFQDIWLKIKQHQPRSCLTRASVIVKEVAIWWCRVYLDTGKHN